MGKLESLRVLGDLQLLQIILVFMISVLFSVLMVIKAVNRIKHKRIAPAVVFLLIALDILLLVVMLTLNIYSLLP